MAPTFRSNLRQVTPNVRRLQRRSLQTLRRHPFPRHSNSTRMFNTDIVQSHGSENPVAADQTKDSRISNLQVPLNNMVSPNIPEVVITPVDLERTDEEDVVFVGSHFNTNQKRSFRNPYLNSSLVLPHVLKQNDHLRELFHHGRSVMDALFLRMWATTNRWPIAPERLSRPLEEVETYKSEIKRLQMELEKSQGIEQKILDRIVKYGIEKESLLLQIKELKSSLKEEQTKGFEIQKLSDDRARNAKIIISGLRRVLEDKWSKRMSSAVSEIQQRLKVAEDKLKESNHCIEEFRKVNAILKTVCKETTNKYKKNDYCCVCFKPSIQHCCLNTNYCSQKCEDDDAFQHKEQCKKILNNPQKMEEATSSQNSEQVVVTETQANTSSDIVRTSPLLPTSPRSHRSHRMSRFPPKKRKFI